MGVLQEILQHKRAELKDLAPKGHSEYAPRPISLERGPSEPLRLITEIKFRSPSAGPLSTELSVEQRAVAYQAAGSSMLSILCDRRFFDGSYAHLARARAACSLPLLCKEFIIDPVQLDLALEHGADAVLLIVRCLDDETLRHLHQGARERGLAALVEVHTEEEVARALDAGASWIGVNARDLDTLSMDIARANRILRDLPSHIVRVHLSGIRTPEDVARLASTRPDAALVGETLMRQADPTPLLESLVAAAAS